MCIRRSVVVVSLLILSACGGGATTTENGGLINDGSVPIEQVPPTIEIPPTTEIRLPTVLVNGNYFPWPRSGQFQIQLTSTLEKICETGESCELGSGDYLLVNLGTGATMNLNIPSFPSTTGIANPFEGVIVEANPYWAIKGLWDISRNGDEMYVLIDDIVEDLDFYDYQGDDFGIGADCWASLPNQTRPSLPLHQYVGDHRWFLIGPGGIEVERTSETSLRITEYFDFGGFSKPATDTYVGTLVIGNPLNQSIASVPFYSDEIEPVCHADDDSDQIVNGEDNCLSTYNPLQEDFDGDGLGNACDSNVSETACPIPQDIVSHFLSLNFNPATSFSSVNTVQNFDFSSQAQCGISDGFLVANSEVSRLGITWDTISRVRGATITARGPSFQYDFSVNGFQADFDTTVSAVQACYLMFDVCVNGVEIDAR